MPPRGKKKSKASRKRSASGSRKSSAARKTRRAAGSRAGAARKSARKTAASRKGAAKRGAAKGAAKTAAKRRTSSRKPSASTRRAPARPAPGAAPMTDDMLTGGHAEPEDLMGGGSDELLDEDADLELGGEEGGSETDLDEDL